MTKLVPLVLTLLVAMTLPSFLSKAPSQAMGLDPRQQTSTRGDSGRRTGMAPPHSGSPGSVHSGITQRTGSVTYGITQRTDSSPTVMVPRWAMQGYDAQRTGRATVSGPVTNTVSWTYRLTSGPFFGLLQDQASPVVGPDGTIYQPTEDTFYAINPGGTLKWLFDFTGFGMRNAPALSPSGNTVYIIDEVGFQDYRIDALDTQNGGVLWRYALGTGEDVSYSSMAVDGNGTIYVGTRIPAALYAVHPDGTLKWRYAVPGGGSLGIEAAPAIDVNGNVYVEINSTGLVALDADGNYRWTAAPGGDYGWFTPTIGPDGTIYVAGDIDGQAPNQSATALNPDGSLKWQRSASEIGAPGFFAGMAISIDGSTVYTGRGNGNVYALNAATGATQWVSQVSTWDSLSGSPALGGNGILYLTSSGGELYAVWTGDGSLLWQYELETVSRYWGAQSPALGPDGTLYAVSSGLPPASGGIRGRLYAFKDSGCWFMLGSFNQGFLAAGGTGSVNVTAGEAGCNWTAVSNDTFITITSGSSGSGNGTVDYSVEANPSAGARVGTMTIAGRTFRVNQAGIPPSLGNYPNTSVSLGANTTVTPDAAPFSAASMSVSTTSDFKGTLAASPTTGVVTVTNAQPAGTYLVTVTAFNSAGTKTFTLTVNNPTPCDSLHFSGASGSPVTVGSLPAFEAVGDFNGDGNQDFAVANWGANNVTVLLGNGSGGFIAATGSPFAVGSHPTSIAVADFDGNGRQDLAITKDGLFDNVVVLLGNGSGGFSPASGSPFDAGYTPQSVAVGDFNGDGKPDLATANWNSNNVTVLLGNGGGGFSAAAGSPFPASTNPASVAIGDFNGDGKADLTIANRYANSVTVLLGNGGGGFNAAGGSPFTVGANPTSVAVGDFNRDGKLDFATANRGAGNVTVLLGDGGGSFSPATGSPFAIGSGPLSVACADFNGDGKLDLTTANLDSNNVTVLLGNGSGGFSAAPGSPFAVGSSPYLVVVGDFNGDGKLDLTSVNDGSNNVSVLLNTCTANTAPTISALGVTRQQEIRSSNETIANVNDLEDAETSLNVTVNGGPSATVNGVMVSVFSTSATGVVTASVVTNCTATTATFTLRVTDTAGLFNEAVLTVTIIPNTAPALTYASPQSVVLGGSLNVTPTAAGDNGTVSYSVQPGHGLTAAPTVNSAGVVSITNAQPSGGHSVTVRATDNCGVMTDAAFTLEVQPQPPTLGAYPNTSVTLGANATVTPDAPPTNTTSIDVSTSTNFKGELEGDPTTGIVRATDAHPAGVYAVTVKALNSGAAVTTKTFTLTVTTPATCNPVSFAAATNFGVDTYPVSVAVGDFNGDGKQDLASANETSNSVSILLGTGTGGFGGATNFSVGAYPFSVAVGDFNGDGKQDLAVANSGSDNVSILLGTGTGSFGAATNFAAGSGAISLAVGDFNGDGHQDLATANTSSDSSHTVSILLGTGTGSFGAATDFFVGYRPSSVSVGDFNEDGHQDLAVANESFASLSVSILLGTGTGSFGAATNFGVGGDPVSVAVGDFNGDGHQDLATASYWTSNLSILLGTGTGSFAAATNVGVGDRPSSVAVGDFNGDGKQDLATVHQASSNASILLGTGTGSFGAEMNSGVGTYPTSVAIGDFNGDGQQDLAVANESSNNVSVLLRQCQPSLSINSTATQTEGDSAQANMTFTVTLSSTSSQTVTVHYSTADGSVNPALGGATCGGAVDYVTTTGILTFNPGDTTRTIDVPICGDTRYEPSETLNVTLDTPANATIASGSGTGTITDNDPMPAFTIDDVVHNEGNTGATSYTFTVTKTGSTVLSSSVNFATVDGTATIAGNDYQAQVGTLTFLSTDTTKTITVLVNGDTTFESDEDFTVLLSGATNATISDAVGAGAITNDDNAPAFVIDDAAQPEGNVGTTVFTFTVTKTGSTALTSSVDFTTVDGTATVADNDYQPNSGTLIFQPGDTSKTITVLGNGDLTIELHETFTVHLSNANNATITDADGNGFIANDDMPVLSIDDVTHVEGNGGTTAYTFTVTKTGSTTLPAAVSFATVDGSATTADNDYQSQTGRLTFQPSETAQTITVLVNGDTTLEPNETFTVHLSSPSGSTIGDADGVGTITNDDVAPPTLGNYPNKTVQAGANTTVTPDAAPTGTISMNASTAGAFKGTLAATPTTGVVYVTNAQPAGTYTVTITAFNSAGAIITKTFTLTVTNPAPCDLMSFGGASGSPFAAGTHPIFLAVGDFNLDGKQDVATTNEGSNDVTVLLGAGGGVFNPASGSPFAAGTQPESLAVGDFNGDGKPDLAAANYDFSNVTVLLGDGLGGFSPASGSPVAAGFHPRSIAVGDFNGDGKPDLVTASASSASVTVLLGNGSGGFSEASGSPFGVGNGPLSITVGDFNSDGKPDVATANRLSNNVSVLLGNGSGGFSEATGSPFAAGSEPYSIAVGDLNADGKADLTTANNASNNVTVLLGNGSGGFTAAGGSPFAVGTNPASVAVGDFNGDGKPDLITANWISNNVTMLLGNGSGGFSEAPGSPLAVGAYPYSVAVGDYNADGRLDLATANHVSNNVTVLLNTCAQNTAPAISAVPVSRQQGSPSANAAIANVNDLEDLETALTFKVNDGASATVNGVTVSGISVSAAGVVTADVIASCIATTATFTLRVTDTGALFNEATLTVTVNPNTVPILTYASPQSVIFGGVLNVVPTSLSDNGAVTYQVMPGHGLTSVPTVDSNGVVSITNTQPEGGHFVTIRATDNCGAVTDASFSIDVGGMPRFAINDVSHNEGDTGTLSYTFTVTKTGSTAADSSVNFATVDGTATTANNDYQANSGVLNFAPSDTSKPITVIVNCDTANEPDEAFTVHLSAAIGARITAGDGTGAIINDDCSISLSNNAENFTAAGGAASVTLTTSSACTWTAVSNDAFITINSGASGFGNGTVNYSVAVNTGPARTGTMTIAAQTFTVTQDSGCAFLLSSGSQNFVAGGGANSVNVITATGCQWAAVSNNAFITIDSGATGSGNGTVGYTVAVNSGPPRTGTMTIAGITFTVTQDGGCAFTLNRDHQSFPGNGGIGAVNVTSSDPGCAWTASTTSTFVTITSESSGTGNGTVQYTVAANGGSTIRSETITIAGHTFTVYQGINFLDVPSTDPFYNDIGKLAARGVTLGCTGDHTLYCPNDLVTREQMAAFILRAKGEFNPPAPAGQRFNDVPPANVFYNFIDRLAESQITLGCTPDHLLYCPADPVKREQMAAFILRGLGEFNPPIPSSQRFDDVPPANVFYNFIDRLAVLNITLGCTPDHVMYCPGDSVTRAQMAAFLVRAFNL